MARILFVDDDTDTLQTLGKSVQLGGHQAILAESAAEGLRLACSQHPDLMMIDMRLPDMDGLTLLKHLREAGVTAQIPVIMLSASPEVEVSELSRMAGAQAFLNKPIRLQTLLDTIRQYTK